MANFIVATKLTDTSPPAEQMGNHLAMVTKKRGEVLPNVWWVDYHGSVSGLRDWVQVILRPTDMLIVIEAKNAAWTDILLDGDILAHSWGKAA